MRPFGYLRDYFKRFFSHFFLPGGHNAYRPRILHRPWLIFFLAVILATEGFLVSNLIARQSNQQFLAAVVPAEIVALTNTERADNNVGNLTEDALLDSAAEAKAADMSAKGYFAHVGPDGKTPWQWISASGYQYQYAGENLAVRFVDSADVVNAWMASPAHRANMIKPVYTQIGVGVAEGLYQGQPATYVVQYFGTPKSTAVPAVVPAASKAIAAKSATAATAALAPRALPRVEGASTEAPVADTASANSFTQTFAKQLLRALSEPKESSNLILGFIAVLLLGTLTLTFFTHLQIQHGGMLAAGAFVAALALFFFVVNTRLVGGTASMQAAAVATSRGGVIITQDAAGTGYALFPN